MRQVGLRLIVGAVARAAVAGLAMGASSRQSQPREMDAVHCETEQDRAAYFSGSIMMRRTCLFWA